MLKVRLVYFLGWFALTIMYLFNLKKIEKDYKEYSNNRVKLIRKVDLWETKNMLQELHELLENNQEIRDRLNFYIEKNARQLRFLENKNELSKKFDKDSDNS